MVRLTEAQRDLLSEISDQDRIVSESYITAKKLVRMGLAVWREGRFGSSSLSITEAGLCALQAQGEKNG